MTDDPEKERIAELAERVLGNPDWKPSDGEPPPGTPPGDSSETIDHLEMVDAIDQSPHAQALRKKLSFHF